MGGAINNESTTTEPPPLNGQQPMPQKDSNTFYWLQIFALDSAVVKVAVCLCKQPLGISRSEAYYAYYLCFVYLSLPQKIQNHFHT